MRVSKEMVKIAFGSLEEKKAEDIQVIEIGNISTIADYFIITNGSSIPHIQSLVDAATEGLSKKGYEAKRIEGTRSSTWILLDYGDIVIHVFSQEDRLFYNLERIWRDGRVLSKDEIMEFDK